MLDIKDFTITTKLGNRIQVNDVIENFRGEKWVFLGVAREKQPGKSAKVRVRELDSDWTQEFYAGVFELDVEPK